jgi:MFS family permease
MSAASAAGRQSGPARLAPFVAATALGSIAYIAAFTSAALAAREITGKAELSGLPSALGTIGTAGAIALLSAAMARRGRRPGLLVGFAIAVAGGAASVAAIALASFPLLLAGSLALGFGNAAIQLSRYAATDLLAPERRASAVGTVVWGSTAGAVLGPNLVAPAGWVAQALGRPALEGGMTVTMLGFALALLVTLVWIRGSRPANDPVSDDPAASPDAAVPGTEVPVDVEAAPVVADRPGFLGGRLSVVTPLRVRVALVALVAGQVVMVLIMTMTPVHIRDMGETLSTVGLVISAHTLGMFALSPLSGRLVQRFGAFAVLYGGFATLLLASILAAVARNAEIPVLTLGLFLLGYGWNLGFVAGSSLLTSGASLEERIRLQGVTDVLVWTAGAAASVSSGLILDWLGYQTLAVLGGAFLAIPALTIFLARRRVSVAVTAGA